MKKHLVEDIRVKLASGIYDNHLIFTGLAGRVTKEQFDDICEFKVFPEVRPELQARIEAVGIARSIFEDYQDELRKLVIVDEALELKGKTHSDYTLRKGTLDERLKEKLSKIKDIRLEDLRRYLVA